MLKFKICGMVLAIATCLLLSSCGNHNANIVIISEQQDAYQIKTI